MVTVRGVARRAQEEVHLAALRASSRRRAAAPPAVGPDGQARILAVVGRYVPKHRRGAQISLHDALAALVERGHEVTVAVSHDPVVGCIDGVEVVADDESTVRRIRDANVVATQLVDRKRAMRLATRERRPLVFFSHVGDVPRSKLAGRAALTVSVSEGLAAEQSALRPGIVMPLHLAESRYLTTPGDRLTLVNLLEGKGSEVFFALARRLPAREFLGVRTFGHQDIPAEVPANVELVGPVEDMREVYARTRVMLAPSIREAFGRVPLEAAVSGIPTISHPNSGNLEALGDAALWAWRDDLDAWVAAIESLDDPDEYRRRGALARARAEAFTGTSGYDELDRWIRALAARSRP